MKNIPHRLATGSLWAVALGVCFSLPGFASGTDFQTPHAVVQSAGGELHFDESITLGRGEQSALAVHPSGLIVSVFRNRDGIFANDGRIVYRLGKFHGSQVAWGQIEVTDATGFWPAVAISKEGYVIIVYNNRVTKTAAELFYQVGWIDPNGDANQAITMKTDLIPWDAGHNVGIAMNNSGVIVGVHEAGRGGDGIYYRVGHLQNPAGGDYTIQWDSAQWGIKYDVGANPRIAINNHNEVISVHQVPGESLLHYRRGIVSEGTIQFTQSMRYNDHAADPSVALLDSGLVLEVHKNRPEDPNRFRMLMSRTGNLSRSDPARVDWADAYENPLAAWDSPAIATNGTHAIETHTAFRAHPGDELDQLTIDYCVAKILYANGTLVRGSSDKVYVVLNDYRFWIPDPDTFAALGYRLNKILSLSDNEVTAIPEGVPFPSVVPVSGPLNYPNGTLLQGSAANVYVVLNDHRHWIPDETTFAAMGYKWENLIELSDDAMNALPEGTPFPSVAR